MKKDIVIIGAGPAGLFCAYELINKNPDLNITILEKGNLVENRFCPMNKLKTECKNCNPCNILSGYGGAGTFSDGKLNFIPKLGKSDLFKYMSEEEAYNLIDYTESIFNKFNMDAKIFPSDMTEAKEIQKKCTKLGMRLLLIKQKHLGSDHLPSYIDDLVKYLKNKKIDIKEKADVITVDSINEDKHIITYKDNKKEHQIEANSVVIAPGRTGAKWVQELAEKYNIDYLSQSIEIGVRVEVRKDVLEELCNVIYDPTIFIKTKTYQDEIRTFCTNPGGFVTKEN